MGRRHRTAGADPAMRTGRCGTLYGLCAENGCKAGLAGIEVAGTDRHRIHAASIPSTGSGQVYGSRKIKHYLRGLGHKISRKRVQRLMGILGLAGMAPGPDTSRPHPQHKVYPYLLRGVNVARPNQAWSADITYIRLARGFVYLVAVIDWYSRKVLSWRLSNTPDSGFCVDCLEQALQNYGTPEIFNTDQGCHNQPLGNRLLVA